MLRILQVLLLSSTYGQFITKLGSFPVSHPAFTSLYYNERANGVLNKYDLLISTFNAIPFSTDSVQIVKGIGNLVMNASAIKPSTVTTKTTWPNEATGIPVNVFGKRMVVIPDGFLVPLKSDGSIRLVDISNDQPEGPYIITDHSTGQWFYHRVLWKDVDGDGDVDAITCRARVPIIGSKQSELIWLENPNNNVSVPWQHHLISAGPDIFFEYVTLNSTDGPFDCIVVAEFFNKKLSIFWTTDEHQRWSDLSKVKFRAIDDTIGALFDISLADINNDGRLDILATNNGYNGSLFVYEIPDDFRTGTFVRHLLATDYIPLHIAQGRGSPGSGLAVNVVKNSKPVIVLSGDDNGHAYILIPKSQDTSDWQYIQTSILTTGGQTIGKISSADVDGDGLLELFVPSYSTAEVFIYRIVLR